MADIIEWNQQNSKEGKLIMERIEEDLAKKSQQKEEIMIERAAQEKKLKKNFAQWAEENPFNEEDYTYPDEQLIIELIKARLADIECNSGVILTSDFKNEKLWKDTKRMMELFLKATEGQIF